MNGVKSKNAIKSKEWFLWRFNSQQLTNKIILRYSTIPIQINFHLNKGMECLLCKWDNFLLSKDISKDFNHQCSLIRISNNMVRVWIICKGRYHLNNKCIDSKALLSKCKIPVIIRDKGLTILSKM